MSSKVSKVRWPWMSRTTPSGRCSGGRSRLPTPGVMSTTTRCVIGERPAAATAMEVSPPSDMPISGRGSGGSWLSQPPTVTALVVGR